MVDCQDRPNYSSANDCSANDDFDGYWWHGWKKGFEFRDDLRCYEKDGSRIVDMNFGTVGLYKRSYDDHIGSRNYCLVLIRVRSRLLSPARMEDNVNTIYAVGNKLRLYE